MTVLSYDQTFTPPAPVVDVTVLHPIRGPRRVALRGKLDTGADVTVIPDRVVAQLRVLPHGQIWTQGYDGALRRRPVYYVRLIIDSVDLPSLRCIATNRANVLLGRNVLNRFAATLDGKNLTFDLIDP